jgi:hypothetical protein
VTLRSRLDELERRSREQEAQEAQRQKERFEAEAEARAAAMAAVEQPQSVEHVVDERVFHKEEEKLNDKHAHEVN